ncbi:MAG: hypothetical protein E5Y29_11440 [Mesorhizobium sp.]|nr:MAG: hypothetical protein E5Y29_11440 [Mesorhizobium sp.]
MLAASKLDEGMSSPAIRAAQAGGFLSRLLVHCLLSREAIVWQIPVQTDARAANKQEHTI